MFPNLLSSLLGISSAGSMAAGHIFYFVQLRSGRSVPNAASWAIWTFAGLTTAFSYRSLSGDDILSLWSYACAVMCVANFTYAASHGKFQRLTTWNWIILFGCIIALTILFLGGNARGVNGLLVVVIVVSFIPTISDLRANKIYEAPSPWLLFLSSHSLAIINVIVRWHGEYFNLAIPGIYILANSWVIKLAFKCRSYKGEGDDER